MREPFFPTRTRAEIGADNRAELDAWIDERAAALAAAGMASDEARRRAAEEFGDADAAARYAEQQDVAADRRVRALLWLEELASDGRIALRTLRRTPTLTAVIFLTFALGIGATTAVFSVVHAMLLRPLPYGDEATLVQLQPVEDGGVRPAARYSAAALAALRERTTSFAGISAISAGNVVVTENGDPEQVTIAIFTPDAFDVLRVGPAIGRTRAADGESRGVVLLDSFWRQRFAADPRIVGRRIAMGLDGERREVLGVMPPGFRVPTYEAADILTVNDLSSILRHPISSQVRTNRLFGRLKPGLSVEAAQADVDRIMRGLQTEFPRAFAGIASRVVPIRAAVAGDARLRLLVLMGASGFVLLIACANVAGILLSRALARGHELSVRVALGAGRRRLIRQFLAEGAVLAAFGAALGLLVAAIGIVALRQTAATTLPAGTVFAIESRVLWFAIATAITAAMAASLVPALGGTRSIGIALRYGEGRVSPSRASRRLRLVLVAAQIAVSVVLLVGAGLLLRTLHRLSSLNVGYSTEHALTFRPSFTRSMSDAEQDAFYAEMYEQLRAIPGVVAAGGGNVPMSGQSTVVGLEVEGRTVEHGRLPDVRYTPASDGYFATLGVPILRGRTFNAGDRDSAPAVAVVSLGLARHLWPDGDPLGVRVKPGPNSRWVTIVGVAGDVRSGSADPPVPSIYTSQRQDRWPGGAPIVVRAEGDPAALAAAVRQTVKRVDPTLAIVGLRTLENWRRATPAMAERRMQMQLLLAFALVAVAVSAIGVYGVGAYATEARRREFGIRLALGASQRRVLQLALHDALHVGVVGALAGIPIAVLLASRLRGMLYAVTPFDPMTVGAALAVLSVVVSAASLVPARRAALIDPARTMRTD